MESLTCSLPCRHFTLNNGEVIKLLLTEVSHKLPRFIFLSKLQNTSMAAIQLSLKLLIDTKRRKVLYAEAGKDFIDFLFNILALPLGSVIRLLKTKEDMVGCLANLYESIEDLDDEYMQPDQNKDSVLKPKTLTQASLLLPNVESSKAKQVYLCGGNYSGYSRPHCKSFADDPLAICPVCGSCMNKLATYVAGPQPVGANNDSSSSEGGYVKGLVRYMVRDDLVVEPISTISCIILLNEYNVKEIGALEEKVVDLGMDEGVKLLKASLQSKTVLTTVFLG